MQVLAAEEAGAVAAVIINSEHTMMPMGEDERYSPTIPSIHIPLAAGQALRGALAASGGGLWGTLRALPDEQGSSASRTTAASAAAPVGRPAAGSQMLEESQVAGRSSGQCKEGSESVREQKRHERTQEIGIDDYYSPEEDTDDNGDEGESSVGEGSCLLDSSAQLLSAGEGSSLPASPHPEQQAEEQGVTLSVLFPLLKVLKGSRRRYVASQEASKYIESRPQVIGGMTIEGQSMKL